MGYSETTAAHVTISRFRATRTRVMAHFRQSQPIDAPMDIDLKRQRRRITRLQVKRRGGAC